MTKTQLNEIRLVLALGGTALVVAFAAGLDCWLSWLLTGLFVVAAGVLMLRESVREHRVRAEIDRLRDKSTGFS